jgi:hypothetical protein
LTNLVTVTRLFAGICVLIAVFRRSRQRRHWRWIEMSRVASWRQSISCDSFAIAAAQVGNYASNGDIPIARMPACGEPASMEHG